MAPRRKCPVCGSKQWHKEPSSGMITCSEGHVLLNHRSETNEAEEFGPHAVRKRALKSTRKKKGRESKADLRLYHGLRARYHYFQCQQLILRHQVSALTVLWKLPREFEIICRDVWSLHLSLLPSPPPAEPYFYLQEMKDGIDHRPAGDASHQRSKKESNGSDSESASEDGDQKPQKAPHHATPDPELEELLRINSESSSSDDEDGDEDEGEPTQNLDAVSHTKKRKTKRKMGYSYEGPTSNIAVLLLACWTMRVPVMSLDFTRIIESHHLPYFSPLQYLPNDMKMHLNKHNIQAMSPLHAPSTLSLHTLTSRLAKRLHSSYGVLTPEVNAAPILWRTTKSLGGTPTLYNLTKRVSCTLSLPLTLNPALALPLVKVKDRDPLTRKYDNIPPELAFLSVGIVVLKMIYGLDGKLRLPSDPSDPACCLPQIDEYMNVLRELDRPEMTSKDAIFNSATHMSVGDLSDDLVDEYLTFCENALQNNSEGSSSKSDRRLLDDYFPAAKPCQRDNLLQETTPSFCGLSATALQRAETLLPGEAHLIYNARDVLGTLPGDYQFVLEHASRWVGIDSVFVGAVVEKYERRLMEWWKKNKRSRSRQVRKDDEGPDQEEEEEEEEE